MGGMSYTCHNPPTPNMLWSQPNSGSDTYPTCRTRCHPTHTHPPTPHHQTRSAVENLGSLYRDAIPLNFLKHTFGSDRMRPPLSQASSCGQHRAQQNHRTPPPPYRPTFPLDSLSPPPPPLYALAGPSWSVSFSSSSPLPLAVLALIGVGVVFEDEAP
jgi:hypothetical protein